MKKLTILFVVLGVLVLIGGWFILSQENLKIDFTIENYPDTDGSSSAWPLREWVACRVLDIECEWWTNSWDGTKHIIGDDKNETLNDFITLDVINSGTHGSYVNLIEEDTDLIIVAREPSSDEIELAAEEGIILDIKSVAIDAFVFIVNKENSVEDIELKEIQDIYTGKITNWNEIGSNDAEINAYQRNRNSGSQELMQKLVMKDLEMIDAPIMVLSGMIGPINMLSRDEDGLGYSVYFYEEFMAPNEEIKLIAIDGVMPNYESIKAREYPLTADVFVVIRSNEDGPARNLRDWLLTDEGQEIVKETGYVPIR
jgi:phosphate transport system substrate-binding protein